jgi:hypothetical protein
VTTIVAVMTAVACGRPVDGPGPQGTTTAGVAGTTPPPAVSPTDLIILGAGDRAEVEAAVRRHGGTIVRVVEQTETYTARFPVASLDDLVRVRDALRAEGVDAVLDPVLTITAPPR